MGKRVPAVGRPVGFRLAMDDLAQVIHPADLEWVAAEVARMRTDPAPFAFEHRIVRADGATGTVLARGEGVIDQDGRVVRFIGTDQDITAQVSRTPEMAIEIKKVETGKGI